MPEVLSHYADFQAAVSAHPKDRLGNAKWHMTRQCVDTTIRRRYFDCKILKNHDGFGKCFIGFPGVIDPGMDVPSLVSEGE